jgi:ribA/ribD-fused uncharacterized protein
MTPIETAAGELLAEWDKGWWGAIPTAVHNAIESLRESLPAPAAPTPEADWGKRVFRDVPIEGNTRVVGIKYEMGEFGPHILDAIDWLKAQLRAAQAEHAPAVQAEQPVARIESNICEQPAGAEPVAHAADILEELADDLRVCHTVGPEHEWDGSEPEAQAESEDYLRTATALRAMDAAQRVGERVPREPTEAMAAAGLAAWETYKDRTSPARRFVLTGCCHMWRAMYDAAATGGQETGREPVFFYEREFYPLSNFSAFKLRWNGSTYDTSEAAYHCMKFPERPDIQERIYRADSAHVAFKIAETHRADRRPDWDDVKVGIMREIVRAKAEQHEYVRRKLLETGDRPLIEDSWRDDYWGWGPSHDGQNMLGRLWMEVRAELRAAARPEADGAAQ